MPKQSAPSLADELRQLKPKPRLATWFEKQPPEVQAELRAVAVGYRRGDYAISGTEIATWLRERLKLDVGRDAIIRTLKSIE